MLTIFCFRVTSLMATQVTESKSSNNKISGVPIISQLTLPLAPKVLAYIEECTKLCKPDGIYICNGSDQENEMMLKLLQANGSIEPLPKYENWCVTKNSISNHFNCFFQ